MSSDQLSEDLRPRGFKLDTAYVDGEGRMLLVITGPGLEGFAMFTNEATALAAGRVTPAELHASRMVDGQ